ncbi:MAG: TetR family transcriptional regulator [Roseovarius sp.]|nr:TetR family transcriptional regulator [Roseovarius sp.]
MTSKPENPEQHDGQPSKSEQTRETILEAAAQFFCNEGYSAATMRKIAKVANMEAGSIYYYFSSKEDILGEVLELGLRRLYDEASRVLADAEAQGKEFAQVLAELVDTHLTFLLTESDFTSANIRNFPTLPDDLRQRHRPLRRAYSDLWNDFLTKAQQNGSVRDDIAIRPVRQFVLGALNWTVEWYDTERFSVAPLSERATRLLLDGMAKKDHTLVVSPRRDDRQVLEPQGDVTKAARTRKQVLSAAARVIRDRGYKAATMRAISAEAGVEAGSIYYHFGSKDEILDEVLDSGIRDLLEGVEKTVSDRENFPDDLSRIAAAIDTHLECLFQASEFASANLRIYGQLPQEVRARHRPVRNEYAQLWDRILKDAQDSGSLRSDIRIVPLRQVMLGALNWTVEWFDQEKSGQKGNISLAELIEILQKLLLGGLSK